jgi:hypothetical protein
LAIFLIIKSHNQSCKNIAQHVGVLDNGQLKSALATHRNDKHAMFGVRLIVSVLQYFQLPIILSDFMHIHDENKINNKSYTEIWKG